MSWKDQIVGSESEKNIKKAFLGEALAQVFYQYAAEVARSENHERAAVLFERMADNEREHGRVWFQLLAHGQATTEICLEYAAGTENNEWKHLYPHCAQTAREEGIEPLAQLFEKIGAIENDHEKQFQETLVQLMQKDSPQAYDQDLTAIASVEQEVYGVFEETTQFRCLICGNLEDTQLAICPVCGAVGSFV